MRAGGTLPDRGLPAEGSKPAAARKKRNDEDRMSCPIMWSPGPYRDGWRNECPACGREGVTSTEQSIRWHP